MEHPILFSEPMVKAILEGRKTQTRRIMNPQPIYDPQASEHHQTFGNKKGAWVWEPQKKNFWFYWDGWAGFDPRISIHCPYGRPDDELWVRETWTYITKAWNERFDAIRPDPVTPNGCPVDLLYRADGYEIPARWTPSIFMPRWASRIILKIVNVRVERIQQIKRNDAKAEGVSNVWEWSPERYKQAPYLFERGVLNPYIANFSVLWDSINDKRGYGWDINPWVWVVEFRRNIVTPQPNKVF